MKTKLAIYPYLVMILLIWLAGCQNTVTRPPSEATASPQATDAVPAQAEPTNTPASTPTTLPTATPSPTALVFAPANTAWGNTQVKRICVRQEFRPGMLPGYSGEEANTDRLLSILTGLGFKPVLGGDDCDATLDIVLSASRSTTEYQTWSGERTVTCNTGAEFYGLMVLSKPGLPAMSAELINGVNHAPLVSQGCPDQAESIDTAYSQAILEGLSSMLGPRVITALFNSPDRVLRGAAYLASEVFGPGDLDLLPEMLEALKANKDISAWSSLAGGLRAMGPQAQREAAFIVPALIEAHQLMGEGMGEAFVSTFANLGEGAKEAVPLLLELYRKGADNPFLQNRYLRAIADIGPGAAEAAPQLARLALDEKKSTAVIALGNMGPVAPEVLATVWQIARNREEYPVGWIVSLEALAKLHAADPEIVPYLISLSEGGDERAAVQAIEALKYAEIPPEQLLPLYTRLLSSPLESIRLSAMEEIKRLGPALGPGVKDLVPALLQSAKRRRPLSVEDFTAMEALSVIASDDPAVIALFEAILVKDRSLSDFIWPHLGPEYRPLLPLMVDCLRELQSGGEPFHGLAPMIRGMINITGAYPGYLAEDWE